MDTTPTSWRLASTAGISLSAKVVAAIRGKLIVTDDRDPTGTQRTITFTGAGAGLGLGLPGGASYSSESYTNLFLSRVHTTKSWKKGSWELRDFAGGGMIILGDISSFGTAPGAQQTPPANDIGAALVLWISTPLDIAKGGGILPTARYGDAVAAATFVSTSLSSPGFSAAAIPIVFSV